MKIESFDDVTPPRFGGGTVARGVTIDDDGVEDERVPTGKSVPDAYGNAEIQMSSNYKM